MYVCVYVYVIHTTVCKLVRRYQFFTLSTPRLSTPGLPEKSQIFMLLHYFRFASLSHKLLIHKNFAKNCKKKFDQKSQYYTGSTQNFITYSVGIWFLSKSYLLNDENFSNKLIFFDHILLINISKLRKLL